MIAIVCRTRAKRLRNLSFQALAVALLAAGSGHAQVSSAGGQISTPNSSIEQPGDVGVRAHTNIEIFTPHRGPGSAQAPSGGASPGVSTSPSPQAPGTNEAIGSAPPQ